MNRRKKSALFSVTLAGIGLVTGTVIALTSNTHAAEEVDLEKLSIEDISTIISEDVDMSTKEVIESLETKTIIVSIPDVSVLENDPSIVRYKKLLSGSYLVEYKTAKDTAEGYKTFADNNDSNAILNAPLKESRFIFDEDNLRFQAWGVRSMKLDTYADSLDSSTNTVTVAVLDSGINKNHIIFSEKAQYDRIDFSLSYDYINNDQDAADDDGHGTMVSGVIAESTPSNVKIIPVKVLDNEGNGDFNTLLEAVTDLAGKVDIINMSLGQVPSGLSSYTINEINSTMQAAKAAGTILVAAAGNESISSIDYPAASDSVISATSVDNSNQFSSSFSNHGQGADFAAPGQALALPYYEENDSFSMSESGTSFSCPFIAAAIANVKMENPNASYDEVYNYLKLNAEDLGDEGWDEYFGWGSLSFHVNKYADLKINSVNIPSGWTNQNVTVTVNASSTNYNIQKNSLGEGTVTMTPSSWANVTSAGKTIAEEKTITKNGTYTIWLKNSNNETASKTFTVNNIDKSAPTIATNIKASEITEDSVTLSIAVNENESGLAKIDWYYKEKSASSYTKVTDTINANSLSSMATTKSHKLTDLEAGDYVAYAEVFDKAGNKLTSASIEFKVEANGQDVGGDTPTVPETPDQPDQPDQPGQQEPTEPDQPKPVAGGNNGAGAANPKTDSQSIIPVSIMGGAFVLVGAFIAIRRRR